jgi:hypothetical protein
MPNPVIGNVTWTTLYDASLGTLPTAQGWGLSGTFSTASVAGGWLRLTSAAGAYYSHNTGLPTVASGRPIIIQARARLESGHVYSAGFTVGLTGLTGDDYVTMLWHGSWPSWAAGKSTILSVTSASVQTDLLVGLQAFDHYEIWRPTLLSVGAGTHETWYRDAGAYGINDVLGVRDLGQHKSYANQATGILKLGDIYDALGCDISVSLFRIGICQASQILSTTGKVLFDSTIGSEAPTPSVAVTISPATVGAGADATATAVITGAVDVIEGGTSWDGSPRVVVTGTAGALIGPTAPTPLIGQSPINPRPVIAYP